MTIDEVLTDLFKHDDEVMDCVYYVLATLKVNQSIVRGLATDDEEVKGVSPLELRTMRRYENGMITNEFYLKNFAVIKSAIALHEIKVTTAGTMISYNNAHEPNRYFYKHVEAIFLAALDIFTIIGLLHGGAEFAERVDMKLRSAYQLNPEFDKWLESHKR